MKQSAVKSESFQYVEIAFKEWLESLGYADTTVSRLPVHVREFFSWLEQQKQITQIQQIKLEHIHEHYRSLKHRQNTRTSSGLSNGALNKHLQALYNFVLYLRQTGRHEIGHLDIRREEKNSKPIQPLTTDEIKQLYKAAEDYPETPKWEAIAARDKAMLSIFYGCGLRRNEGYHLDLSDVNFDRQVLHVRKGKNYKERFVPFNKTNAKILEHYVFDYRPYFGNATTMNAFFVSVKGFRMEAQSMSIRLKLLKQKTNNLELQQKDINLHLLRHSIATHLLSAGMTLENVSRFLGHSSLESTQIYTHLVKEEHANI